MPALHLDVSPIEITGAAMETGDAVRIDYRLPSDPVAHWLVCRFADGPGRPDLIDLASDRFVELSPVKFAFLKRFWLGQVDPGHVGADRPDPHRDTSATGLAQRGLDAAVHGALYGLLAVGFSMFLGLIGRFRARSRDILALAAFGSVPTLALIGWTVLPVAVLALPPLLLLAALALDRGGLSRHLMRWSVGRLLIVAVLVIAVAAQVYLRVTGVVGSLHLHIGLSRPYPVVDGLQVTSMQILVLWLTLGAALGLLWMYTTTGLGRRWRGRHGGLDEATAATSLALGATFAAVTGALATAHFWVAGTSVDPFFGLKALVAAAIAGRGRLGVALLGGFVVAGVEAVWIAHFGG